MRGRLLAHGRRRRRKGARGWFLSRCEGQSTVEYLLLLTAFAAMIGAFGLMWHAARDGVLVSHATDAASHSLGGDITKALKDIVEF